MIDEKALEAAARALCVADGCHGDDIDDLWRHYASNARACVQAYLGALDGFVLVREADLRDHAANAARLLPRRSDAAARPPIADVKE